MPASSKYGQLYNALSGLELRKKILHDVEVMLDSDDRFRNHITYPRVKFKFSIEMEVYPSDAQVVSLSTTSEIGDPGIGGEPRTVVLESSSPHQNPDATRHEIGVPVPHPQNTPEGVVDLTKTQADEQADNRLVRESDPMAGTIPAGRKNTGTTRQPTNDTQAGPGAFEASPGSAVDTRVEVSGHGGVSRVERTEIPGHVTPPRPLVIPHEPANGRIAISNDASQDGAFGTPLEVEIVPRG